MKIKLDPGAVMPTRAHPYDAGLDLFMPKGGEPVYIPPFGDCACCLPPLEEVDTLETTDRGSNGFGSSGR